MADWDNVTDVSSLKAMLAAQQAQLQHLQSKETVDDLHAKSSNRKRKTVAVHQGEYDTSSFSDEEHATAVSSASTALTHICCTRKALLAVPARSAQAAL